MPKLPIDPVPYAEFIRRHLMQRISPDGNPGLAVAETEQAIDGDRWLWADDNAKVLEFMALPALWQRYPAEIQQIFDFVCSLCEGPFILRRTGYPRLERSWQQAGQAKFLHTFMDVACDLPRGVVSIGMRFHDGRTARNLILTGNYIQFDYDGTRYGLDVEDSITSWDIEFQAPQLKLLHRSELVFEQQGRPRRLGQLSYTYRLDARSMFVDVEAELEIDPAITVSDVVLTIGQDNLSHNENAVNYGGIFADTVERGPLRMDAGQPGHTSVQASGAQYWSLVQRDEMRGFALAIHSMAREPARMATIEAVVRDPQRLHYVVSHHRFPGRWSGTHLRIAERKIVTAGGFYDQVADCSAMFRRRAFDPAGTGQPVDLSISYDYGAELAAFARCHRTAIRDGMPADAARVAAESRRLFDHFLEVYRTNFLSVHHTDPTAVFSRPLAFVALGLVDMWKATQQESYRDALREVVGILLEFERPFPQVGAEPQTAFVMGQRIHPWPYMDCHAAALLALVRALPVLEHSGIAATIDRGLNALHLRTVALDVLGGAKADLVGIEFPKPDGEMFPCYAYWNFCAGLCLRVFQALRGATHPALVEVLAKHQHRIGVFEAVLHHQLGRSVSLRPGLIEIRTSALSTESNSETQPWVALGLVEHNGDD